MSPLKFSTEYLRSLFDYDAKTGSLLWKVSRGRRAKIGCPAGYKAPGRYVNIRLDGKVLYAHRLIWIWHGRELPEILDHINCDMHDNRIENLRAATHSQSQCNQRRKCTNTSGVKGVSWNKRLKKWYARVHIDNRVMALGLFKDLKEAASVVEEARRQYHGEFARHQ